MNFSVKANGRLWGVDPRERHFYILVASGICLMPIFFTCKLSDKVYNVTISRAKAVRGLKLYSDAAHKFSRTVRVRGLEYRISQKTPLLGLAWWCFFIIILKNDIDFQNEMIYNRNIKRGSQKVEKVENRGGRRAGSGRKPLDRKPCLLRLTDDERIKVKKYIEELRAK